MPEKCTGCGLCELYCPGAIILDPQLIQETQIAVAQKRKARGGWKEVRSLLAPGGYFMMGNEAVVEAAISAGFQFFTIHIILADEWALGTQPLRYEWGLEYRTQENAWGLEEQTLRHEKSDSIVLQYNGKTWGCIYNGHGVWLNSIYGFDWNDIFAVGDHGIILHFDSKSWTTQKTYVNYR